MTSNMSKLRFGEIMLQEQKIDEAQLQAALGYQRRWGKKLGECLVQLGFMSEDDLVQTLSKVLKVPAISLSKLDSSKITKDVLAMVSLQTARSQRVVPLAVKEIRGRKRLVLASSDPTNIRTIDDIQFKSGLPVLIMVATDGDIEWFIRRHYLGEHEVLPHNYLDEISSSDYKMDEMQIDPVSSIFFDAQFTGFTQIGKTNPAISVSRPKRETTNPKKPKG